MNSKRKGNEGEAELMKVLVAAGIPAQRSNQWRTGGRGHPDVGIPGYHIECKRTENLNVHTAFMQAVRDAEGLKPCVAHRRSREPWLITLRMDDFIKLYTANQQQQATIRELVHIYGGDSSAET